jgi:hypothetical protein
MEFDRSGQKGISSLCYINSMLVVRAGIGWHIVSFPESSQDNCASKQDSLYYGALHFAQKS